MTEASNNNIVSIIIPVYNVDFDLLKKCINSCICQTYKILEILIMANGITDEYYEHLIYFKQLDNRIKVIKCDRKGVSIARNEGIKLSNGSYIAFIDADDYLENNYIEKLVALKADIAVCSFYKEYFFKSKKNIITNIPELKTKDEFVYDLLNFQKAVGCVWGKLFNANYLKENNVFFDENLNFAEDADFVLRVVQYNPKIIYVPDVLCHYVISKFSTVRNFDENYFKSYKKALNKMENIIDKTKYLIQWNNFVAHHLLIICVNYVFNLQNRISYDSKKQILKEILNSELFANGLKLSRLKDFPFFKKTALFFLKHKIFFAVYMISVLRNKMR